MQNLKHKPLHVYHASLAPLETGSLRRMCPVCPDGMLVLERDPATLKVKREDRCLSCGQAFVFRDEPLPAAAPGDAENKRLRELNQAASDRLHEITREANGKFRYAERVLDALQRVMAAAATVFGYIRPDTGGAVATALRDYDVVCEDVEPLFDTRAQRPAPRDDQAHELVERFTRYLADYTTAWQKLDEARLATDQPRRSDALAHWAQEREDARALLFDLVVKNGAALTGLLHRGRDQP